MEDVILFPFGSAPREIYIRKARMHCRRGMGAFLRHLHLNDDRYEELPAVHLTACNFGLTWLAPGCQQHAKAEAKNRCSRLISMKMYLVAPEPQACICFLRTSS